MLPRLRILSFYFLYDFVQLWHVIAHSYSRPARTLWVCSLKITAFFRGQTPAIIWEEKFLNERFRNLKPDENFDPRTIVDISFRHRVTSEAKCRRFDSSSRPCCSRTRCSRSCPGSTPRGSCRCSGQARASMLPAPGCSPMCGKRIHDKYQLQFMTVLRIWNDFFRICILLIKFKTDPDPTF